MATVFERKLAAPSTLILDGGLATELERRGSKLDSALWSALVLAEHPDRIRDVHTSYLLAGSDCIVSSSYQASVRGFRAAGFDPARSEQLYRDSIRIAFAARNAFCRERHLAPDGEEAPLVAASMGPYGAYLADGSEFRGNYGVPDAALRAFHSERIALAIEELWQWTDEPLLAFETVPSLAEARLLLELLAEHPDARAWLSFSCRDAHGTCEGQGIAACVEAAASSPQIVAVGVNCTAPEIVADLIPKFAAGPKPTIAYPNAGGVYDADARAWRDDGQAGGALPDLTSWARSGVRILGGCCRTTPDWIAQAVQWRDRSPGS